MKNSTLLFIITAIVAMAFVSYHESSLDIPDYFPKPVYGFEAYPLSQDKINLGRALFYDPILSRDSSISCASCHSPYNAFAHSDHELSHGIDDQMSTRNAPALFNLAWNTVFMWDGAIHHIDMQPLAPISSPVEMDETLENVVSKLSKSAMYKALFQKAFGSDTITGAKVLKSLSQFQLTLLSTHAKYDSVQRGKTSFTIQEEKGYRLFIKHCNSCHREPLFTTSTFANNGLPIDTTLNDKGKWTITQNKQDSLHFKIPSLRNLSYSAPYMHDGRFRTMYEVLRHYTSGIVPHSTLTAVLATPIVLSSEDKTDLISFLLTLDDKNFIQNPENKYPRSLYESYKEK